MSRARERLRRRFWVPEVIQSSLMDCGPAALEALVQGFGLRAGYEALRERCATDVDGTSIDALAAVSQEFGLTSYELLVPRDVFLLPEARCLPAIVVTRAAGGTLHFMVVWRRVGPWLMVMDPASGRRWLHWRRLLELMPELPLPVSARRWRRWAESPDALAPLAARLQALGVRGAQATALIDAARGDVGWRGFATLDAALRLVAALVGAGALCRGGEAARFLSAVTVAGAAAIPPRFHWVSEDGADSGQLLARGSVIVHFCRAERAVAPQRMQGTASAASVASAAAATPEADAGGPLWAFFVLLWRERRGAIVTLAMGVALAALLVLLEGLALRALLDVTRELVQPYQRAAALAALLLLLCGSLGLELWLTRTAACLGSQLELQLRMRFLSTLPLLPDRYVQSRPRSDLAERGHSLHVVRQLPNLWLRATRSLALLIATTAALAWLHPQGTSLILGLGALAALVPWAAKWALAEGSARLKALGSGLGRFYLDALLGATPVRVHGASEAVRIEHEQRLTDWARTARSVHARSTLLHSLQLCCSTAFTVAVVSHHALAVESPAQLLLLAYWALRVPVHAAELAFVQLGLRSIEPLAVRLRAPLLVKVEELEPELKAGAELHEPAAAPTAASKQSTERAGGVELTFRDVTVHAGGHLLLADLDLQIAPGSHVAIVGASGAGKSSFVGLLLGHCQPSAGCVYVGGNPLDRQALAALRRRTVWVDPAVQLWDAALYDNLVYGAEGADAARVGAAVSHAELPDVLQHLSRGLQAPLGESGVCLSGGQGQRVRLGRGLMREAPALVILDEPFRGLERERRRQLARRVREQFRSATLLFVSHDVEDTRDFERVLVFEGGKVLEDASPTELLCRDGSRYAALLGAAQTARTELWSGAHWRRAALLRGKLQEHASS